MSLIQDRRSEPLDNPHGVSIGQLGAGVLDSDADYVHGEVDIKTASEDTLLWYFAYGSNMDPNVLTGRRGVQPKRVVPCEAPGYRLLMSVPALPWGEPGFASVGKREEGDCEYPTMHGTACLVTLKDYLLVRRTEGGGGHDGLGYQDLWLTLKDYKGRSLRAVTLNYQPEGPLVVCAPSQRYMSLIVRGARVFGVQPTYLRWLETHGVYRPASFGQKAMRAGVLLVLVPLIFPIMLTNIVWARTTGRPSPRIFHMVMPALQRPVRWFHDNIGQKLVGSGTQPNAVFDATNVPSAEELRQQLKKYL